MKRSTDSKDYRIPFGQYKGQTIDHAASTDEGLRHLDWMRGIARGPLLDALDDYLSRPSIAAELDRILDE